MIALNEQMKIINRILPIHFSEDEFRLTEELTHNRIYKRLDSLESNVLLDTYYNIKLNHFDECSDVANKYTYLLYTILLEVLTIRKVDYNAFVTKRKARVYRINLISIVLGIILFLCFSKFLFVSIALVAINGFITYRWRQIISKVGRKFKIKLSKIQEYKAIFLALFLGDSFLTILSIRAYNSVLYLLLGYIFVFLVYRKVMKMAKTEKALKFEEKWKVAILETVKYLILLWIIVSSVRPILDMGGYFLRTSNYKYIEGICMEVKDLPFGFKKGKVNNVEVILADRNNLEVGNLYRIVYGEFTSGVFEVKQITVKTDSKSSDDINKQLDEFIEDSKREEAKKVEEELEENKKEKKKK